MSKKICILAIFLTSLFINISYAQSPFGTKEQKVLSAYGRFYSEHDERISGANAQSQDFVTYGLDINAGKFYKKNVLSSIILGFSHNNTNREIAGNSFDEPRTFFNIGISQTYYTTLGKKFYFGIGGVLSGNYGKAEYTNGTTGTGEIKYYVGNFSIVPSLAFQINKRFVANLSTGNNFVAVNYVNSKRKETNAGVEDNSTNTNFGFNAGFNGSAFSNLNLGFSYLLK